MAIAVGPHAKLGGINGGTTGSLDTSGMSLLVAVVGSYSDVAAPTLSDSKANTWTAKTASINVDAGRVVIHYAYNPTVGTGHTFTLTGTGVYAALAVCAFSGVLVTDPFDVENGAITGAATSLATGSITPSQNDALLIAGLNQTDDVAAGLSINLSYTIVEAQAAVGGVNYGTALAYLIQTTAGASNPTWSWTTSAAASARIAAFKAAAGPIPHVPRFAVISQAVNRASRY